MRKVILAGIALLLAIGLFGLYQSSQSFNDSNPRQLYDPILGRLGLDEESHWWTGRIVVNNVRSIDLSLHAGPQDLRRTIREAREFYLRTQKNDEYYRTEAARRLLDTYNQNWNPGRVMDAPTFKNRLVLEAIFIYASGEIRLFYDDGGLFAGHVVVVHLDRRKKVTDADIAG